MEKKKIQAGDFQLQCLTCIDTCRKEKMTLVPKQEQQPFNHLTSESRNGKCISCSEFNVSHCAKLSSSMSQSDQKIQHIRETALDMCNYLYRHSTWGANFKECRIRIATPFLSEARNKGEKEYKDLVKELESN